MNLKNLATTLMVGALSFFINGTSFAAGPAPVKEDHIAETNKHIDAGIAEGKQGHADVLVTHAKVALQHGRLALSERSTPMMEEGLKFIREGIDRGEKGNAETATKSLEEAKAAVNAPKSGYENSAF